LVVLYDGHCTFCTAGAERLRRFAKQGALELVSFQDEGVLARFPSVSYDAAMKRMHVVEKEPGGRTFAGAAAVARVLETLPALRPLAALYRVPGLRHLADATYDFIARNRYRFAKKTVCDGGTCHLHMK
jgi:predicted DCC family thiol-disulfide oxidoreductase YuxK